LQIIYIFTSPSLSGSSVQDKVLNQIKHLNKAGADCRGAFFSTEVNKVTALNEYVNLIPIKKCNWKYFKASGQKRFLMKEVLKYAKINYNQTDYFYFRYPGAGYLLKKFTSAFGKKTIFEHLCIEEFEIKSQYHENPFGLRPSRLISWIEYNALPLLREKMFGKTIRKNARLGICNSSNIADFQIKKSGGNYQCIIGGDAVDVDAFEQSEKPKFDTELNLVFLKGASTSAEYNGLDRIFNGLKEYKGNYKIKLYVLGKNTKFEENLCLKIGVMNSKVFFPGFLRGESLNNYFNNIHIGVSQFGIHRKGLENNTTIKSREYIARGIPFIYGHSDPDLNDEAKAFSLQFPNDDSNVNIEKVIKFAEKAYNDKELSQKMRKYALEHLDYSVKMKKLLEKIQNL
jgi:hypothetical protein